ncbi:hypothetical protein LZC95_44965 [Pendulispora brunnea]|uniref:Uncharacterized protein n=1 Tax=Pendulispora brunnea TaxID=2905690 RepID=A0ABZ2K8A1_9BACT
MKLTMMALLGASLLACAADEGLESHDEDQDVQVTPSPLEAAALPLGKTNFTMAIGGLRTSSRTNWVRLGMYTFSADGKVSERHWHWSQSERVNRTYTGFVANGCVARACNVQTANGYDSTGASETLSGTFSVNGTKLHIAWSGGQWEDWTLGSLAGGALANVELAGNNFGATHGYGNGSNAAWSARKSAATIAGVDHTQMVHRFDLWKTNDTSSTPFIDHGDGAPFWVTGWSKCSGGSCLGARTGSATTGTEYYVAPANSPTGHRRDTLWHWRIQLADARGETCYTGNSHVKPLLQVVDDNGVFHGWVGVEASLNQTAPSQGALADDIGVFRILR